MAGSENLMQQLLSTTISQMQGSYLHISWQPLLLQNTSLLQQSQHCML